MTQAPQSTLAVVGRGASGEKDVSGVKRTVTLYKQAEVVTEQPRGSGRTSAVQAAANTLPLNTFVSAWTRDALRRSHRWNSKSFF